MLVERGGSPLALQVNASVAHRRRVRAAGDELVDAELELVIALAAEGRRAELAARVSALADRWRERDPARAAALNGAAERLATGVGRAPTRAPPSPRTSPVATPAVLPAPEVKLASAAELVTTSPPGPPLPQLRSRAPAMALAAVLLLGLAGGGAWLLTRGGKKDVSVAAAARQEVLEARWNERVAARKDDGVPVGLTRKFEHGVDDPLLAPPEPELPPTPAVEVDTVDTADALFASHRGALERGDWGELGSTVAADVFHWGPDAATVVTGRDAMIADLRAQLRGEPSTGEVTLKSASSWGGAHEDVAWSFDDLSWSRERPGRKASVSRFLISRVAMRRGDRWEIVASTWAHRTSDARLSGASAAGVAPALAAVPETPDAAPSPIGALHQSFASRDAFEAFVAPGDGVHALGSDAERDEGSRAVARRYKKLAGKLYPLGGARFVMGADGLTAWVATNVELVSSSKANGDVVLPYRLLAVLTHDPGMGTWKAVMLHWSAGGPVPRVKSAQAKPSAEPDGDEPVADPSMVPATAAPLTGTELRAAFGAVQEAVEACRGVAGDEPADSAEPAAPPPRVLVKVVASVTADGSVDGVDIEGAWAGTAHAACVEEVVAGMTFRAPGAAQTVRYPFAL